MIHAHINDIVKCTKGKLVKGNEEVQVRGVSIDSRTVKKGNLFIAIKGVNFDGHRFVAQAIKKGAAAIIVSKRKVVPCDVPTILVNDTTQALGEVARFHRCRFSIPLIAITGSTGKTTTKDMIAAVLKVKFKVLKNIKTENNQFGVPLTLLKLNASYDVVVLELGTNQPGDIPWLAYVAQPTVAVFTNIGESHLQGLKTPQGVFREKYQLIKHTAEDGTVIFNGDDIYLKTITNKKLSQTKITFSIQEKSDYQAMKIKKSGNYKLCFQTYRNIFSIVSPAEHNIYNALAAMCCGRFFKISFDDIKGRISRFKGADGRQIVKKCKNFWLIDDTYNSNPVSFKSALKTLSSFETKGRKILVFGDMMELGSQAQDLHQRMGKLIRQSSIDAIFTFGQYSDQITKEITKNSKAMQARHCKTQNKLQQHLQHFCQKGDVILIKGSRSMKMERVVDFLCSIT